MSFLDRIEVPLYEGLEKTRTPMGHREFQSPYFCSEFVQLIR